MQGSQSVKQPPAQAICKECKKNLNGTWNISSDTKNQFSRSVSINDGYFLGLQNQIFSYCQTCWQKVMATLPQMKSEFQALEDQVKTANDYVNELKTVVADYKNKNKVLEAEIQMKQSATKIQENLQRSQMSEIRTEPVSRPSTATAGASLDVFQGFNQLKRYQEFLNTLSSFESTKQKEDKLIRSLKGSLQENKLDYVSQQNELLGDFIYVITQVSEKYKRQTIIHCNNMYEKLEEELLHMRNNKDQIQVENIDIYDKYTLGGVNVTLENAITIKMNYQQKWQEYMQVQLDSLDQKPNTSPKIILDCFEDLIRQSKISKNDDDQKEISDIQNTFQLFQKYKQQEDALSENLKKTLAADKKDFQSSEKELIEKIVMVMNQVLSNYQTQTRLFSKKMCDNLDGGIISMKKKQGFYRDDYDQIFEDPIINVVEYQLQLVIKRNENRLKKWQIFQSQLA